MELDVRKAALRTLILALADEVVQSLDDRVQPEVAEDLTSFMNLFVSDEDQGIEFVLKAGSNFERWGWDGLYDHDDIASLLVSFEILLRKCKMLIRYGAVKNIIVPRWGRP